MFDSATEAWTDMRIPRRSGPPTRNPRLVETPDEFAEQLVTHGLPGKYRVIMGTGEIWLIEVEKYDAFRSRLARAESG